jgi:hypothetical protein
MKATALAGKLWREKEGSLLIATSYDIITSPKLNSIFEPSSVP